MNTVRRLPLWQNCLDRMKEDGLEYGRQWSINFFEIELSASRDTLDFNMGILEITKELEKLGYALSRAGTQGKSYSILQASANENVIHRKTRSAFRKLERAHTLGKATNRDKLTQPERTRLDTVTERTALKLMFLRNTSKIARVLKKKAPELLGKN